MKTIEKAVQSEINIKKSQFICSLFPTKSKKESKEIIQKLNQQYHDATHNCTAYIKNDGEGYDDNGEPGGTAGKPMINALRKNDLHNVTAVVTRYFGGIKLGAGGLIRAYSGSVAHAIEEIGRVEVKELTGLTVELTYSQYQVFSNFLEKEGLQEFDTTFLSDVSTTLFVEKSDIEKLGQELTEFYQGKVNYEKSGKKIVEIPI